MNPHAQRRCKKGRSMHTRAQLKHLKPADAHTCCKALNTLEKKSFAAWSAH